MDHDLVARLPLGDALADLPDDPGGVRAADVVAVLGVVAVAEDRDGLSERGPDVVEVDARGHHPHDHLEGAGLGHLDLLDLEGVLGLALALLPDHPGGHLLGQLARLDVELGYVGDVYGQLTPASVDGNAWIVSTIKRVPLRRTRAFAPAPRQIASGSPTTLMSPMEASEKPQLPLEQEGSGSVRVVEDRIVIERLTIADGETARVVRDRAEAGEEPARSVRRASRSALVCSTARTQRSRSTTFGASSSGWRGCRARRSRRRTGRQSSGSRRACGGRLAARRGPALSAKPWRAIARSSRSRSPRPSERTARERSRRRSSACWTSATRSSSVG